MLGNILGKTVLSIITDDPVKFHLAIGIHNICCRLGIPLVHTHIQRRILPVGKAPGSSIQLIGGNSQIQINAVHLLNTKLMKDRSNILIVASYHRNLVRKRLQAFGGRRDRVCILVDADQPSADLIGMSASAQGSIHIDTVRPDVQAVNRFIQ